MLVFNVERLREAMDNARMNQSELAACAGVRIGRPWIISAKSVEEYINKRLGESDDAIPEED